VGGRIAVERDPVGRTVPFNCSDKEAFGCCYISMLTQQEINCQSPLIDSAVEVRSPSSDSDVGFVHTP
jgi:hypothetical protein